MLQSRAHESLTTNHQIHRIHITMRYIRRLSRLLTIYWIVVRFGLDELLFSSKFARRIKIFLYLTPGYWLRPKHLNRGMRIRLALEALGPIFVKFGQILSTRRDLLPEDVALELAKLQDEVAPFSGDAAREIVERSYGQSIETLFARFETTPMAAASIAQVHAARLPNGREVVVKILRPNIETQINKDIELLYMFADLAKRLWRDGRRLRPLEVVAEFEKNLANELDLLQEAANATQLKRNFDQSRDLYVPEIEWDYCQPNVIVMERISGIQVTDIETLKRLGVNFKHLAEIGVEIFFTQVFRDNFFHADMHPGNVFVDATNPLYPNYIAIDFGIMGTLSSEDKHYLAENFLAFFNRDYRRVAELHVHSGWVPPSTRVEEFEGAIRSVCEPIFDRPIKEISFGMVLLRLFQTARRFNMEVQPQLVLLQKTLLNIEGIGRQLYPDLDLWTTAKPFLQRWMNERVGWRGFVDNIRKNLPFWAENLPDLPMLVHESLVQRRADKVELERLNQHVLTLQQELRQQHEQRSLTVIGSALIISGSIMAALETQIYFNVPLLALGGVLGTSGALFILMGLWRSPR